MIQAGGLLTGFPCFTLKLHKMMERQSRYLKGYSCFNYVMSSEAVCFVMHLLDVKYLHDKGYNICWTQEEYIARMGMGRNPFLKCLYELNRIGLLVDTPDETGERVAYTLNMPAYDKLVKICGATYNSQRLKEFLNTVRKTGRRLKDIPDREITLLGSVSGRGTKEAPYVKYYTGFSYALSPDEICLLMHMVDIEFLARYKPGSFRKKEEWLARTGMNEPVFDKSVRNLERLEMIKETTAEDRKPLFVIFPTGYDNLVAICGTTYNYHALKEFFTWFIQKQKRPLNNVLTHEIEALKNYGQNYGAVNFPFPVTPKISRL